MHKRQAAGPGNWMEGFEEGFQKKSRAMGSGGSIEYGAVERPGLRTRATAAGAVKPGEAWQAWPLLAAGLLLSATKGLLWACFPKCDLESMTQRFLHGPWAWRGFRRAHMPAAVRGARPHPRPRGAVCMVEAKAMGLPSPCLRLSHSCPD